MFEEEENVIIIGGIYREICTDPKIDYLFGSGLRSACAISRACPQLELVSVVYPEEKNEIDTIARSFGFTTKLTERNYPIQFHYETPISEPKIITLDPLMSKRFALDYSGDVILVFGILEATIKVHADRLVIDPQGLWSLTNQITWSANHTAIVGNRDEILLISEMNEKSSLEQCAENVRKKFKVDVVVVKCGALGAIVVEDKQISHIGVFPTTKVNPLGSGDIFSAVFAYYWAEQKKPSSEAANLASRATATWVSKGPFQLLDKKGIIVSEHVGDSIYSEEASIYLAGPFFTLAERWLVDTSRSALVNLGAKVFSPIHDVGKGSPDIVAPADIDGLKKSDVVLALLDGFDAGTVYEVGYANSLGKPVVGFVSDKSRCNLTMFEGSGVTIFDDISYAVYNSIWKAMIYNKNKAESKPLKVSKQ